MTCHSCRLGFDFTPPMPRSASCPKCHSDARCCLNCRFFDASAHHGCREEQASWVKDKERGNFCSYFSPGSPAGQAADAQAARAGLDALFAPAAASSAPSTPSGGLAADLERFLAGKR